MCVYIYIYTYVCVCVKSGYFSFKKVAANKATVVDYTSHQFFDVRLT